MPKTLLLLTTRQIIDGKLDASSVESAINPVNSQTGNPVDAKAVDDYVDSLSLVNQQQLNALPQIPDPATGAANDHLSVNATQDGYDFVPPPLYDVNSNLDNWVNAAGAIKSGLIVNPNNDLTFGYQPGVITQHNNGVVAQTPLGNVALATFDIMIRDGTVVSAAQTNLDPSQYDDSGVLTTLPADNDASFQEIYINTSGDVVILLGQMFYTSVNFARQTFFTEKKVVPAALNGYVKIGGFVLRKDATDLQAADVYPVFTSQWSEVVQASGTAASNLSSSLPELEAGTDIEFKLHAPKDIADFVKQGRAWYDSSTGPLDFNTLGITNPASIAGFNTTATVANAPLMHTTNMAGFVTYSGDGTTGKAFLFLSDHGSQLGLGIWHRTLTAGTWGQWEKFTDDQWIETDIIVGTLSVPLGSKVVLADAKDISLTVLSQNRITAVRVVPRSDWSTCNQVQVSDAGWTVEPQPAQGNQEVLFIPNHTAQVWECKQVTSGSPERELAIANNSELQYQPGVVNKLFNTGTHTRPTNMVAGDILSVSVHPGETSIITGIGTIANAGTEILFKSYLLLGTSPDVWVLYSSGASGLYKGVKTRAEITALDHTGLSRGEAYTIDGESRYVYWDETADPSTTAVSINPTSKASPSDLGGWLAIGSDSASATFNGFQEVGARYVNPAVANPDLTVVASPAQIPTVLTAYNTGKDLTSVDRLVITFIDSVTTKSYDHEFDLNVSHESWWWGYSGATQHVEIIVDDLATGQIRLRLGGSRATYFHSMQGYANAANGFVVPTATTLATPRNITLSGGLNTINGIPTFIGKEGIDQVVHLNLNPGQQIDTVSIDVGTVNIVNPLTGHVNIVAGISDGVITVTEKQAETYQGRQLVLSDDFGGTPIVTTGAFQTISLGVDLTNTLIEFDVRHENDTHLATIPLHTSNIILGVGQGGLLLWYDNSYIRVRIDDGAALVAGDIRVVHVNIQFDIVAIRVWKDAENGFVVPTGTVAKAQITVQANTGAVNINNAASVQVIEGAGLHTLLLAVPSGQIIDKTTTEAAAPAGVTLVVTDVLQGEIKVAVADGTGNVDLPITFITNPIQNILFEANPTGSFQGAGGIDLHVFPAITVAGRYDIWADITGSAAVSTGAIVLVLQVNGSVVNGGSTQQIVAGNGFTIRAIALDHPLNVGDVVSLRTITFTGSVEPVSSALAVMRYSSSNVIA